MAAKKKAKKAVKKAAPKKAAKKAAPKKAAKKAAPKKAAKKKVAKKAAAPKKAAKKKVAKAPKAAPAPAAPEAAPAAEAGGEGEGSGDSEPPRGRSRPASEPAPRGAALQPGAAAPYFELPADDGSTVRLTELRGRKVVLYFYPRDNTPGCTIEARDFSTLGREFEARNALVLGVSTDSLDSHRKFKGKCDLSVKLLSDADKLVHASYGAWGEKNMYGRKILGTIRSTFLIDEDGRIARVWPKVRVEGHALEVLNSL